MTPDARRRAEAVKVIHSVKTTTGRGGALSVSTRARLESALMPVIERFVADAAAQVVRERDAEIIQLLDEWEAAYPEDVFTPFTAADHPNVSPDRIAAEMARHMARALRKQFAALRTAPPPA